jgi:hypothetical protein
MAAASWYNTRRPDTAFFAETGLSDVDLSRCTGLEFDQPRGTRPIDIRALQRSGPLPLVFLRGGGLPEAMLHQLLRQR